MVSHYKRSRVSTLTSSLPPCRPVLVSKIRRANYVTAVWKGSTSYNPRAAAGQPECHGWVLAENTYFVQWFEGEQLPRDMCQILSIDSVSEAVEEESEEMTHGELLYGSDESDSEEDS